MKLANLLTFFHPKRGIQVRDKPSNKALYLIQVEPCSTQTKPVDMFSPKEPKGPPPEIVEHTALKTIYEREISL